jgi:DNA helicase II / ATP-dependent DNA helicase PcrA
LYGNRESAIPSQFLAELPEELIAAKQQTRVTKQPSIGLSQTPRTDTTNQTWQVGDRILHRSFGIGEITHILGSGNKISLAIAFPSLNQKKIIDPRIAQLEKVT